VNPPAADALLEDLVRYLQLNDLGDGSALLGKHLVEGLSLDEGAGETVEDEAEAAVGLLDAIADDADDDVIGHEAAGLHDGGGLEADLGLGGDSGTEHVAGGELGDGEKVLDLGTVGALSCPRRAEEDHDDRRPVGGELVLGLLDGLLNLLALAEAESGGGILIEVVREGESLSGLSVHAMTSCYVIACIRKEGSDSLVGVRALNTIARESSIQHSSTPLKQAPKRPGAQARNSSACA
jgi:hypothetical protein